MNQIERIQHMEQIMDRTEQMLAALKEALDTYEEVSAETDELESYYAGAVWREDFDADSAGKLPPELKRGVLSEDGIWNLLAERDGLQARMRQLGKKEKTEEQKL